MIRGVSRAGRGAVLAAHARTRVAAGARHLSAGRHVAAVNRVVREDVREKNHGAYIVDVEIGHHRVTAGEHTEHGGDDSAPSPAELVLAAVGSCTAQTIRRVALEHNWDVQDVTVHASFASASGGGIEQSVELDADNLSHEQRVKLVQMAGQRSPVAKMLADGVSVHACRLAEKDEHHHKGRGKHGKHKK